MHIYTHIDGKRELYTGILFPWVLFVNNFPTCRVNFLLNIFLVNCKDFQEKKSTRFLDPVGIRGFLELGKGWVNWKRLGKHVASLVQMVKNPPPLKETWVRSLCQKIPWRSEWLQYPCLENSLDRGAWKATVFGFAKSQTRLNWLTLSEKHVRSN